MNSEIIVGSTVKCADHLLPMKVFSIEGTLVLCGWEDAPGGNRLSKKYEIGDLSLFESPSPLPSLIGEATPTEIAAWKEKYNGKVYGLEVDGHIAYFQNPNRKHMNAAMSKATSESALDMFETLAKMTMIGGSPAVLTDDEMFYGITQQLKTKMDGKKALLVNL